MKIRWNKSVVLRITSSRLARQFTTLLSGRFLAAGIQAASIYLLAIWTEIEVFAMFAAALGLAVTMQAAGDVGASTFIVREAAAHGNNRNVAYAELLSRTVMTAVALAGGAIVIWLYLTENGDYAALLPMTGWIIVERSSNIRSAIARGLGDVRIGTLNIIYRRLLQLTLFILGHELGMAPAWAYSIALLAGSTAAMAVMRKHLPRPISVPIRKSRIKHAFFRCRPYWVHSTAVQLRNADTVMVALFAGATQAAYYGVAARLMSPLRMVPTTLAATLMPYLVKHGKGGSKDIALGTLLSTLIAVPYAALIALSPQIMNHIGKEYASASLSLQLMCIGLIASCFISIFNTILQAHKRADLTARIAVITSILVLACVSVGAIVEGATGAATGFMIVSFIHAAIIFREARRHIQKSKNR